MSDYASLKVPDLKKLLTERSLPQTGNKADLVARLQENDKNNNPAEEDVIDWDDDDTKIAPVTTKNEDPKPAPAPAPASVAPVATPSKDSPAPAAPAPAKAEPAKPAAPTIETSKTAATPASEPDKNGDVTAEKTDAGKSEAAPVASFAAGLNATDLNAEMKKRAERAQRFGIQVDANSDDAKKAERAQRFGVEASAVPKGLDEALPERRPKRGRDGDDRQGGNSSKRHTSDNRSDGRGRNSKPRGGRGGRDGERPRVRGSGDGAPSRGILNDPNERAKAERRAARFGGDN